MTLYRQLLIFTLILFLLLFTGSWLAKLNSTRTFLNDQLLSHAQDTATSLGLSASPRMESNDLPAVETMINAVFDRGYYRLIRLADIEGTVLIDRTLQVKIDGVPQWFIRMVPLTAPQASAIVLSGWRQAGHIMVESHPGYAYKTLWETVVSTGFWFMGMAAAVLILGGMGLRILLKPLQRVEHQAETLCKRQYEIQENLPRTRELRRVVEAMNRMTCKVRDMFEEQAKIAERLRKNAYRDSLTGLGNRRYLEGQALARLDRGENGVKGAFLLVQLMDLQKINQQKGFQAGDELLLKLAELLKNSVSQIAHAAIARLTGGDFGLLLPDAGYEDCRQIAEQIADGLGQLAVEGLTLSEEVGHAGGVIYTRATDFNDLLAGADTALQAARQAGGNTWHISVQGDDGEGAARGKTQWKETLTTALVEKSIILFVQPTVLCGNQQVLHLEIFSRIREKSGKLLSAGMFMPLAERLGLISAVDRAVLEKVMQMRVEPGKERLAINMSPSSLNDTEFVNWVLHSLRNMPATVPRLTFEFAEFSAVRHLELVSSFGARVQALGHGYGLDHFGQGLANFGYLKSLRPEYVKIDRAYTNELKNRESDSYFFIGSLTGVAHSLDILVVAEGVETEEQAALLRELNLDAIQGYYSGRPRQAGLTVQPEDGSG